MSVHPGAVPPPPAASALPGGDVAPASARRCLVVGLGSVDRGDDGVGPAVVVELVAQLPPGGGSNRPRLLARADPASLLEEMQGVDLLVIADAVRTGARLGSVVTVPVGPGHQPLACGPRVRASTHGFSLSEALELARLLDRLPPEVVVVGVESAEFTHAAPMSQAVRAAIPGAARAVMALLGHAGNGSAARATT